jgi:hypothetical protein
MFILKIVQTQSEDRTRRILVLKRMVHTDITEVVQKIQHFRNFLDF